jgi:hypothetical protein
VAEGKRIVASGANRSRVTAPGMMSLLTPKSGALKPMGTSSDVNSSAGGMNFAAISDAADDSLAQFVALLRR